MRGFKLDVEDLEEFLKEWDNQIYQLTATYIDSFVRGIEINSNELQELAQKFNGDLYKSKMCAMFCYEFIENPEVSFLRSFVNVWLDEYAFVSPDFALLDQVNFSDLFYDYSYNDYPNTELDKKEWNKRKREWDSARSKNIYLKHRTIDISLTSDWGYEKIKQYLSGFDQNTGNDPLYQTYLIISQKMENQNGR